VLILSEFAGAAERMQAALLVNPHDVGGMAEAIRRALEMSKEERIERWKVLMDEVSDHDISVWRQSFLNSLETIGREAG
jgi:trehalose 6-phosphate synthase